MARRVATALGLVAILTAFAPTAAQANASVAIMNFSFQPSNVTIAVGETVTWTQEDAGTMHTVTGDSFDSGNLATGQQFAHTFTQPGTFAYHCKIHSSMTGTVTVNGTQPPPTQPPATAAPAPQPAPAAPAPAPAVAARPQAPPPAPPTSSAPTVPPTTTTLAPPAAADTVPSIPTTAAAEGGERQVALPERRTSSDRQPRVALGALAAVLAAAAGAGSWLVRRRFA